LLRSLLHWLALLKGKGKERVVVRVRVRVRVGG